MKKFRYYFYYQKKGQKEHICSYIDAKNKTEILKKVKELFDFEDIIFEISKGAEIK